MNRYTILFLLACILISCQNTKQNSIAEISDNNNLAYNGPIIDVHIHAVNKGDAQIGMEYNNPKTGQHYQGSESAEKHVEETLAKFRKHNIVKAVVSPYLDIQKGTPTEAWYDYVPETVLMGIPSSEYLIGIPSSEFVSFDTFRKRHAEGKLQVMAEMAPMYGGILPTDESVAPYFDLAEELGIPVGYHMLPGGPPGAPYTFATKLRAAQSKPLQFEEILVAYPNMKIYIMHAGWPYLEDMKALLYAHPQVYVDTGVIDWLLPKQEFHSYLKALVDAGFGDRIMYGSDQMIWVDAIDDAIEAINSANFLTLEQKADIFYNNAARFFSLSDEEIKKHHQMMAQ